jgi:hypothetical protein
MVKPFSRPSIDLGKVTRKWQDVEAQYLDIGDLIPDYGKIQQFKIFYHEEDKQWYAIATFREDAEAHIRYRWKATEIVHAFTEVSNG